MHWFGAALCALMGIYVVTLVVQVIEWIRCSHILRKLPEPKGHPLLGQLQDLASPQHHITLAKWAAQLGGIYRMRLAHMNVSFLNFQPPVVGHEITTCALPTFLVLLPCRR